MKFGNNIYFEQYRIAYIAVPKAANSAIKRALLPLIDLPDHAYSNIHDRARVPFPYVEQAQLKEIREVAFVFSAVRNPWERVVSTYNDKICRDSIHRPFIRYGFSPRMTFVEFVRGISEIEDSEADVHFRSQASMLLKDGTLLPHLVVQIEHISLLWPGIQACVEAYSGIRPNALQFFNSKPHDHYYEYYDEESKELVRTRYATDVQLFGYVFDPGERNAASESGESEVGIIAGP